MSRRYFLTGGEIVGLVIAVLLGLLALFMFVGAIVVSLDSSDARAAHVTSDKAWTAALVSTILFYMWVQFLDRHLDRALKRLTRELIRRNRR